MVDSAYTRWAAEMESWIAWMLSAMVPRLLKMALAATRTSAPASAQEGAVSGETPPSTSISAAEAAFVDHLAETLDLRELRDVDELLTGLQPGLTAITMTWSISGRSLFEVAQTGCRG